MTDLLDVNLWLSLVDQRTFITPWRKPIGAKTGPGILPFVA